MPKRRVKLLYVHPDLFTNLCPGNKAIVLDSDIPPNAKRIGTFYSERDDRLGFIIEHESFELVELDYTSMPALEGPTLKGVSTLLPKQNFN